MKSLVTLPRDPGSVNRQWARSGEPSSSRNLLGNHQLQRRATARIRPSPAEPIGPGEEP